MSDGDPEPDADSSEDGSSGSGPDGDSPTDGSSADGSPADASPADGSSATDSPADATPTADGNENREGADGGQRGPESGVGNGDGTDDSAASDGDDTDSDDADDSDGSEADDSDGSEADDAESADDGDAGGDDVGFSTNPPDIGEYDPEDYATEMIDTDPETNPGATDAGTAGAATAGAAAAPTASPTPDPAGAGAGAPAPAGAPDDQEMPLADHIEEMVRRLAVVIVVMAAVSAVVFPFGDRLINFLWYSFLPGPVSECVQAAASAASAAANGAAPGTDPAATDAACPRLYHPLALVLSRLKVASLTGFIIALPVFVYETYLFMRPGLYPNERRYYLASVPTSLVLAGVGVAFAYFLVLPVIFTYFLGYSQPVADIAFGLSETFGLILLMLGMFAVIFQIPLFVMLAIMMGVTSRRWLEDRRLYFWFGFAGVAFLFSPDPTGMAPFIVALTMVVLFEGTLLVLRWTGR